MSAFSPYEKYQEQAICTMTPGELIILLYEKAAFNISMAMKHINSKKLCEAHNHIIKAQDIILYLRDILDMKYPVSKKLYSCYTFVYRELVKANIQKNNDILEELMRMMNELKSVWQEVEASSRGKTANQGKNA